MIEPLVYFRLEAKHRKKDFFKLSLDSKGDLITRSLRLSRKGVDIRDTTYCTPFSDKAILKKILPEDVNFIEIPEAEISRDTGLAIYRPGMEMPDPPEGTSSARILILNPFFQQPSLIRKAESEIRGFRVRLAKKEIATHLTVAASVNSNYFRAYGKELFSIFERMFFPLTVREMMKSNLIFCFEGADPDLNGFFPDLNNEAS